MRLISPGPTRKVYATKEADDEFVLSPFPETVHGRRPVNRYSSQQELELEARERGCEVIWQQN